MASIKSLLCPRRLRWILGACALVTFIAVRPLLAADISGTWDLSCRIGPEQQTITLELVQDGSQVSGFGILRTDDMGSPVRVAVRSGTAPAGDFLLFLVEAGRSGVTAKSSGGDGIEVRWAGRPMGLSVHPCSQGSAVAPTTQRESAGGPVLGAAGQSHMPSVLACAEVGSSEVVSATALNKNGR